MDFDVDNPEDGKLLVLARSARARTAGAEGAALRDLDGRTYAAVAVELPGLRLTALALATAMAVSSGARGLEAAALVTDAGALLASDLAVLAALAGAGVPVWRADSTGEVLERAAT